LWQSRDGKILCGAKLERMTRSRLAKMSPANQVAWAHKKIANIKDASAAIEQESIEKF
jgi:hypothetical protein